MPTAGRLMGNGAAAGTVGEGTAADRTVESQRCPWLCHRPGRGADAAAHWAARTDHAVQGPRSCVLGPGLVFFCLFCSQNHFGGCRPSRSNHIKKDSTSKLLWVSLRSACFLAWRKPQGTLQQASRVSFECIWPKTVGSSSRLESTKSGVGGAFRGATSHILAEKEKIGPNPVEKNGAGLMLWCSWRWTGHEFAGVCLLFACWTVHAIGMMEVAAACEKVGWRWWSHAIWVCPWAALLPGQWTDGWFGVR